MSRTLKELKNCYDGQPFDANLLEYLAEQERKCDLLRAVLVGWMENTRTLGDRMKDQERRLASLESERDDAFGALKKRVEALEDVAHTEPQPAPPVSDDLFAVGRFFLEPGGHVRQVKIGGEATITGDDCVFYIKAHCQPLLTPDGKPGTPETGQVEQGDWVRHENAYEGPIIGIWLAPTGTTWLFIAPDGDDTPFMEERQDVRLIRRPPKEKDK